MSDFLHYVVLGIPYGCVFSLVAVGLVLTYKTAGVFNLAFGAQAFMSAAVFYDVRIRHEWPVIPAAVFAILIVAPLFGILLNVFLFRHLRTAPPVVRLVVSLGLLVAVPQMVMIWLGPVQSYGVKGLWSSDWTLGLWGNATTDDNTLYRWGDYVIDGRQAAILVSTSVVVVGLTAMFRWTSIGLKMRAVVESPRLSELSGVSSDLVSAFSWALSSACAGLAGVLIAPYFAQLDYVGFTIVLVAAISAAAFGRLRSIPLTLLGGLLLGIVQEMLRGYLPQDSLLARNLQPALPFLALFLMLVFMPSLRLGRELGDPLAGVDPPPAAPATLDRTESITVATRIFGAASIGVVLFLTLTVFDNYWVGIMTQGMVYSVIFLSITVITGMAGQISLSQGAFAGMGAFGTTQLAHEQGWPVLVAIVAGSVIAAIIGGLLAIPSLRLGGIYLSLGTLAFALLFENVLVPMGWVGGGVSPLPVERPDLGPFDFADARTFFVFSTLVLAVVATLVVFVRRGTTGRYLEAMRGSEVASESIGINPRHVKVTAFAMSAGIAGLGGGLLATYSRQGSSLDFIYFMGFVWVVAVVMMGSRSVEGAIGAGLSLVLLPELLKELGADPKWQTVLFGLGAITYARHPEGVIELFKRFSLDVLRRLASRGPGGRTPSFLETSDATTGTGSDGRVGSGVVA